MATTSLLGATVDKMVCVDGVKQGHFFSRRPAMAGPAVLVRQEFQNANPKMIC
jgi:hypothetical protein